MYQLFPETQIQKNKNKNNSGYTSFRKRSFFHHLFWQQKMDCILLTDRFIYNDANHNGVKHKNFEHAKC